MRERLAAYEPARVAAITGLPEQIIIDLAHLYTATRPGLIKFADGLQRHGHGGQTVRAILTLPALTGQYGVRGGGLAYSTSGYFKWSDMAHQENCPPPARSINMNRLGVALLGEVTNPPIMSLYVFGSNPAAIAPNAGKVVQGLKREDLFTVVHELFMTDTADYADIVLPATSQLEHADLHKAYGHTMLAYNHPAIPPLGESKSNWKVMGLLAGTMGFAEPWLYQSVDEVIEEILTASAIQNPAFQGITLTQLKEGQVVPLALDSTVPFADLHFPTLSGKVELFSQGMAEAKLDPLPGWPDPEQVAGYDPDHNMVSPHDTITSSPPLTLISGAAHHFVTSSMANQASLLEREGTPFVEINPVDAAARGIGEGDTVIVENSRGWCKLRAVVTEAVRSGVLASPKGRWVKLDGGRNPSINSGRNVNWTTPDALADLAGQSTFHSNRVWIRRDG